MAAVGTVSRRMEYAPRAYEPDTYMHVSRPLVVRTAWSKQRQQWMWLERLDGDAPMVAVHEEKVTEQPVGRLMALAEGPTHYRAVRRRKREAAQQEVRVGMGEAEIAVIRELLSEDAGRREFGNAVPGPRCWRAVARRILGERYPFEERKGRREPSDRCDR